jgi:hypothetical protein
MGREKYVEVATHHAISVLPILDALRQDLDWRPDLEQMEAAIHDAIRLRKHRTLARYAYLYEEELLREADRVSDFHILELAEQKREQTRGSRTGVLRCSQQLGRRQGDGRSLMMAPLWLMSLRLSPVLNRFVRPSRVSFSR